MDLKWDGQGQDVNSVSVLTFRGNHRRRCEGETLPAAHKETGLICSYFTVRQSSLHLS